MRKIKKTDKSFIVWKEKKTFETINKQIEDLKEKDKDEETDIKLSYNTCWILLEYIEYYKFIIVELFEKYWHKDDNEENKDK